MRKIILSTIIAIAIATSANEPAKAGPFGFRGKWAVKSNGTSCCRYALFYNQCITQDWLGDCGG
jgi:hypothetical protein